MDYITILRKKAKDHLERILLQFTTIHTEKKFPKLAFYIFKHQSSGSRVLRWSQTHCAQPSFTF